MKKINLHIILSLFLLLIFACEEKTSWDIQSSESFPVADCIITNEMKYQELNLVHSAGKFNEPARGISDAVIAISDGINSYDFFEDNLKPGRYISTIPLIATAGHIYRLTVKAEGLADTAFAEVNGVSPLDAIDIASADSLFRFVYHDSPGASMTEVAYDWSANPEYCEINGSCQASEVFYTLESIDPGKEFAPDRMEIHFPSGTRIIRRKYSLTYEHERFVRSMLLETDWRGGLFDVEQGNVLTNFNNGFHGLFAACTVLTDTTFFK